MMQSHQDARETLLRVHQLQMTAVLEKGTPPAMVRFLLRVFAPIRGACPDAARARTSFP